MGARVVLVGRSAERLGAVRDELSERYGEDRFPIVIADMSSLESVREAVAQVLTSEPRLDVLIDNAGAINAERRVTDDGMEATFATMVAGPFVLIDGLLPLLEASGDGRVINVVSGGMYAQPLPLDDLQFERGDVRRNACLRASEACLDRADARMVSTLSRSRAFRCHASGLGGHARTGRVPAWLLSLHAPPTAEPG